MSTPLPPAPPPASERLNRGTWAAGSTFATPSTVPGRKRPLTDHDYACWYSKTCYAHWRYWGPSKHVYATWDAARGCSGYVFVITSAGSTTVVPREIITRDPASGGTGACRA